MTAAQRLATDEPSQTPAVDADGWALADSQRSIRRAKRALTRFLEPSAIARTLEAAEEHFLQSQSNDATLRKAAEWFLDNYYLIRRVARQVDEELPRGFVRRLPELASGPEKGLPRIYALAQALVLRHGIDLDAAAVRRFVEGYQEVSPLTIAELWALPTMLRVSVLRRLVQSLHDLHVVDADQGLAGPLPLDPGAGVERAVRALRLFADIDWNAFFEQTNRVEAILREDPAQVYARMDFATCDAYRKAVEDLAWVTRHPEEHVASLAIELALAEAPPRRPTKGPRGLLSRSTMEGGAIENAFCDTAHAAGSSACAARC